MTEVRRLMETTEGYDPAVWKQMGEQLGLQAIAIPEEYGGAGFGYVELTVIFEEMGAALLCAPYFSTVALATNALLSCGDESAKKDFLPGIAAGETIATLALTEDTGRWDLDGVTLAATGKGGDWKLDGHKMFVIDGHTRRPRPRRRPHRQGREPLRRRRRRRRSHPDAARHHGPDPQAGPDRILRAHRPGWWARKAAPARRCRAPSTSPPWPWPPSRWAAPSAAWTWPSTTPRPASSSAGPSVPSRPSSTSVPTCCSRWSRPSRPPTTPAGRRPRTPRSSRSWPAWPSPTARRPTSTPRPRTSRSTAGIGFTWEHDAHLYFKRAKSSELLLGDPSYHRELLAQRIGI